MNNGFLILAIVAAQITAGGDCAVAPAVIEKGARRIQSFDYHGVTLDGGTLRRQFDETRDFYLRIPNDDLLKGFRARAGQPAPGADLGGWYSSDTFHVFGQILSGLARMYAATGDMACRDKAAFLLHEWGRCIEPDGFFFYSRKPNAPHYIYDKMVGGLVDMYHYCGAREAAGYLHRITGWAERNLDRKRPYGADPNEWYTLSENLYRAYLATGETRYRDFARVWEYTEYWDRYARKLDIHGPRSNGPAIGGYHAYSHVNTLGGAGAAYLVTGESHYLDTIRNAYEYLQAHQCFATGGYGPDESLLPTEALLRALDSTHNTFETQCGCWAAFKLCKYLISFTGDARYGDWIERLVINGIGASIPTSADGRVFYYSDYNPSGGVKVLHPERWTCCTGTRPMAVAGYHDLIWFKDSDSLYVNLFADSTVKWNRPGGIVTVTQRTRFPEENTTEFRVSTAGPARFTLSIRSPQWLVDDVRVTVNGNVCKARTNARRWITVNRSWRNGDRMRLVLPMGFHNHRLDPKRSYPMDTSYGPVTMAWRSQKANPVPKILAGSSLVTCGGESLAWRLSNDSDILLRPFYAFKEGEPYYLYVDPAAARRISHRAVTFSRGWNEGGAFRFSNTVGATAEYSFEGTGIRWLGYRFDDAGHAEVRIDGKAVGTVDQYGPGRALPFDWKIEGLPNGKHTIRITLLNERSPNSKDLYMNVAGFELIRAEDR